MLVRVNGFFGDDLSFLIMCEKEINFFPVPVVVNFFMKGKEGSKL